MLKLLFSICITSLDNIQLLKPRSLLPLLRQWLHTDRLCHKGITKIIGVTGVTSPLGKLFHSPMIHGTNWALSILCLNSYNQWELCASSSLALESSQKIALDTKACFLYKAGTKVTNWPHNTYTQLRSLLFIIGVHSNTVIIEIVMTYLKLFYG